MRKLALLAVAAALLLTGCGYGQLDRLPPVPYGEAAEIVVLRADSVELGGRPFVVALDGRDVFALRPGAYTVLKVAPGSHSVAAYPTGSSDAAERKIGVTVTAAAKERVYLYIEPKSFWTPTVSIRQLTTKEGEAVERSSQFQN